MRIDRVQERSPGDAIGSAAPKPSRIQRAGIATNDVISTAARVIGIVDSKLSVIENVKGLGTELKLAGLPDLEMFQQRHIEVHAPRIVQEVPARISEGEPARSHKLRRIADEWAKAFRIVARRGQSTHNVGVRGRDAKPAGNPGVVGQGNTGVAGAVDHRERRARLKKRCSRKLPAVENRIGQRRATVSFGRGRILRPFVGPVQQATRKILER